MSAFKRGRNQQIFVPLRSGALKQMSCGTPSLAIRNTVKRLVVELKDTQRWTLLEAVTAKREKGTKPRLTLLQLYAANAAKELDLLEARLSSVTLASVQEAWLASVEARLGVKQDEHSSAANYKAQVGTFLARHPGATAADITPANVTAWLVSRTKASPGTRRKYVYALKSLVAYLLESGALKLDPLAGYKLPKKNKKRERWETVENERRIVEAASPEYRAFFAFIKATGCDVGTARRTLARDVDLERAKVFLRGTKTRQRQVPECDIDVWALPILREHLKGLLPNAPLWPTITRSGASHHHERCCAAVGVEDYTLKDARHSIGVRMRFAGKSFEDIAARLGNSVAVCAEVYAAYNVTDPRAIEARKVAT